MKKIIPFAITLLGALSVGSCGLMELDSEQMPVVQMTLRHDTIYTMVGDRFELKPAFDPDTLELSDVFWTTSNDSVLSVYNNVFTALAEGWATVRAISVSQQIEDTCHVCVMPKWDAAALSFPYETIIYAEVKEDGKAVDWDSNIVAAYISGELRGVGELKQYNGIEYIEIRVGSDYEDDSGNIDQTITFRLYNRQTFSVKRAKERIAFDGDSHGTLSKLITISFD